jgi:anti-anti-sigma factor
MLQVIVQQLENASVLCCRGRIVTGEAYATLHNTAIGQGHARLLVLDLARVDRIDAGGLGVLLRVREWAQAIAISFKLMNVMKSVEQILELTALDRVFQFCSVRDLLCLLHRPVVLSSDRFQQSKHRPDRIHLPEIIQWAACKWDIDEDHRLSAL